MAFRLVTRVLLAIALVSLVSLVPAFASASEATHISNMVQTRSTATSAISVVGSADTYVSPVTPTANYGSVKSLAADGSPIAEAYVAFDTTAYKGLTVTAAALTITTKDVAGAGMSFYRMADAWSESGVTWDTRPGPGTLITSLPAAAAAGAVTVNLVSAFPTGKIDTTLLSIRIASLSANGVLFWSRESATPPHLDLTLSGTVPAPTPTPTPTASSTPAPTRTPTPTPKPTPTPTPTPKPTPTPTPTPKPTATPTPTPSPTQPPKDSTLLYFNGRGSDHGVGMSQYGALGRAQAGQTYDQILAHYYTDTTLGTINPNTLVRVQLASSHTPTTSSPARITARFGSWQSSAFLDSLGKPVIFPADSYVQMVKSPTGWEADVYDPAGTFLVTALVSDLTVKPVDEATRFEMKWRDSLAKYDLYRGTMRLLVNGSGVQCINSLVMDDYLKGVVPAEMPPLWPIEAVKSQVVASRGYAYVRLRPDRAYDVVPNAGNQVYGGVGVEHPRSNAAIAATANQVVMYDGKPANTFFFTIAGGYTEDNEYAWVGNNGKVIAQPIPYLRGVPDYDANGVAYDSKFKGYAWRTDTFTWTQLGMMLANDPRTNVGTLVDLKFDRGVSGRVYRVTVIGSARTVFVSGPVFKGIFNNQRPTGAGLKSTMFWLGPAPT